MAILTKAKLIKFFKILFVISALLLLVLCGVHDYQSQGKDVIIDNEIWAAIIMMMGALLMGYGLYSRFFYLLAGVAVLAAGGTIIFQ